MKDFLAAIGALILLVQLFALIGGVINAEIRDDRGYKDLCKWPTTRISYVAPAYPLGCWLGSKP